jgi:hypothetical protein
MNKLQGFEDAPVTGGVKTITAEGVLKLIKGHTFGCVVAGGYARDAFFGVEAKDIDVAVYNFHLDDDAEVRLLAMLYKKLLPHGVVNVSSQFDGDEEYEINDARVAFVWNIPQLDMDLIFYNDCKSWSDVVSKFDCNMNQFYLPSTVPDGTFDGEYPYNPSLDESPVYVGAYPLEKLVFIKPLDELTAERISKMEQKHMNFFPDLYPNKRDLADPFADVAW